MRKRRPILLLEFLIALFIMGGVLQMLFTGYRLATVNIEKARALKEKILKEERLQLRLALLFRNVETFQALPSCGFVLKYDGGIDPDPRFRSLLNGYLGIDQKRLVLISWPEEGDPRIEVLHENVQTISLQFFDIATGGFVETYPKARPPMMKALLTTQDNPSLTLPFFL